MKTLPIVKKLTLCGLFILCLGISQQVYSQRTALSVNTQTSIRSVAFSPDGETILTGGFYPFKKKSEERINLWHIKQGKWLKGFKVGTRVNALCFTPDGKKIIAGVGEHPKNEVRAWDIATGKMTKLVTNPKSGSMEINFSKDGSKLLIVCRFHAYVLSAKNFEPIASFKFKTWTYSGNFSGNGKQVAIGVGDHTEIWDIKSKKLVLKTPSHGKSKWGMISVDCSPTQNVGVSGAGDNVVMIWDLKTGKVLRTLTHKGAIFCVAFSPDGSKVATGCEDDKARVWDVKTGKLLVTYDDHRSDVKRIKFSADGAYIVSSDDQKAKVWSWK